MSSSSDAISTPAAAAVGSRLPGNRATQFLLAGLILIALSVVGLFTGSEADPARPFLGWLIGISFWLSILIGMLFLLMIWWMFDSGWSVVVRRQLEHAISAFPYLALIFLPLVILSLLSSDSGTVPWIWMDGQAPVPGGHGTVSSDVLYVHKSGFLDKGFFILRYVLYFGVWSLLAIAFRRWSFNMDRTGDHANVHYSRKLAALGLFLCAFATTFASIDWFKSLSYHWFSTMYGVWFFSACMRAALSATVLTMFYMASRPEGLKNILKPVHFYLMGCLMLAFTVFWAYISFSQYFLIYNANIPEETFWYNIREIGTDGLRNSWWWVSMALIFLHFFVPFLFLLWYRNKFGSKLKFIAIWILVFHLLDLYWNIVPQKLATDDHGTYAIRSFGISWVDITMFLGVGAVVIWSFLRSAAQERPLPIRDPRIEESINCHE
ncbi:MAG TPA: hypothetical protein VJ960_03230 [Oceanipulchritudo sp.]|nr:hypothetical protein [Oceanipulchritudo sp.]